MTNPTKAHPKNRPIRDNSKALTTNAETTSEKTFFAKWSVLSLLCLSIFITVLDSTLLNISLPTLVLEFHTTIQQLQWVISIYSLVLASLMITGGRLGDFYGRKKMFLWGAAIFAVGSFIASVSQDIPMMIFGESIVEGIGGALLIPASSALIISNYHGRDRAIAFGAWSGFASFAAAVGPLLGGFFTTVYSWRWGFRINILVVLILLAGSAILKEYRDEREKPELDLVGIFLSVVGLLAIVFGIIESSTYGWWVAKEPFDLFGISLGTVSICPIAILFGSVILGLFLFWESRRKKSGRTPLLSPVIFRNWQFSSGLILTVLVYIGFVGISFLVPIFLQSVKQLSAFQSGIVLIAYSLSILISSQLSAQNSHRITPRRLIQIGLFLDAIGLLVLRGSLSTDSSYLPIVTGLSLTGLGVGVVLAQMTNLTLSAVSVDEAGESSGLFNTVRQLGVSLSTAITGAVFLAVISTSLSSGVAATSLIQATDKPAIQSVLRKDAAAIEFGSQAALSNEIPAYAIPTIKSISASSVTDAARYAILYNFLFITVGFLFSFSLGKPKRME